jgi:hypothetical protein
LKFCALYGTEGYRQVVEESLTRVGVHGFAERFVDSTPKKNVPDNITSLR